MPDAGIGDVVNAECRMLNAENGQWWNVESRKPKAGSWEL
jgi:hypothetical protein